jgi:4-carboxymuconolactone decarboxylase
LKRIVALARACARAARGQVRPLVAELRRALASGVPPADLREALLQTYLFAGFPRAITALTLLDRESPGPVRTERPRPVGEWRRRGIRLCRKVYGGDFPALMRNMRRAHPDLADWILVEGYGKTLSRPFLPLKERELIAVATLAALQAWPQLAPHVRGAMRAGASPGDVQGLLRGCAGAIPPGAMSKALMEQRLARRRI